MLPGTVVPSVLFGHGLPARIWRNMSHADLVLATLYTKKGPISVEQEIGKDLDRLIAALCCDQLTDKELAYANMDTARRLWQPAIPSCVKSADSSLTTER